MISADDVKKLAGLARLALSEEEVAKLQGEISSIVEYIDVIQKVELPNVPDATPYLELENVMRDDANPHEPGIYTKDLVDQFPRKDGNFLKVKKIL
jgi:aspartyl-tRNA(Asn)/glutamyl-tRNA(Gln) amidotransferase subunit C